MPAATNRADLIAISEKEFAKLTVLMDRIDEGLANRGFEDGWTIRDVILHRAHWIGLFFQWLEEGEAAQMPDHGVKWNQLKPYIAGLRDRYADLDWQAAKTRLAAGHARLLAYVSGQGDAALYGGPMPGGTGWTVGRYAEAAGPSHYRSAAKFIRACLRSLEGVGGPTRPPLFGALPRTPKYLDQEEGISRGGRPVAGQERPRRHRD